MNLRLQFSFNSTIFNAFINILNINSWKSFITYQKHRIHIFTITDPPKLLPKQSIDENRKIIKTGSSTALQCPVEKSQIDDIYFEWFKDGKPVDENFDDRIRMTSNGVLKIKHSVPEDTANYVCKGL